MTSPTAPEPEQAQRSGATATADVAVIAAPAPANDQGAAYHERHLLNLQRTAGNTAVMQLLGVQRAPLQRAPAGAAGGLDPAARVDRLRHAINHFAPASLMIIDVEAAASALADMTSAEGRTVKSLFLGQTKWNLGWLIAGELDIDDKPVTNNLGPFNRRRLLNLLSGTVAAPAVDPMAAMAAAEARGEDAGAAAVAARDKNIAEQKKTEVNRLRAQAIEVKVWLDKGQKEKIFGLLRRLATAAGREERKRLSDAYEQQFGEQLYIALTKRMRGRDWERVGALWDENTAKADRLATETQLEKVKKAEAESQALNAGTNEYLKSMPLFAKAAKQAAQRSRDERAALEAQVEGLAEQPADTAEGEPKKTQLEAALDESSDGKGLGGKLAARKDAVMSELVSKSRRPEMLAARIARSLKEKTLKAAEIEDALRELRGTAVSDARREAAAAGDATDKPPISPQLVVETYFARFQARFAEASPDRPLLMVLMSIGSKDEAARNLALLGGRGQLPEWQELYFALRPGHRDIERVKRILGKKTPSQIKALGDEYKVFTPGNRDLTTDVLGTTDERKRIENPTFEDIVEGRAPKDLAKAREGLEEKKRLMRGGTFEEGPPSGSEAELVELATDLAAARDRHPQPAGVGQKRLGGPPVGDEVLGTVASLAASEGEVRQLREEASFVFGRINSIESAVLENRGTYARGRDWLGNVEHSVVMQTRRDAAAAVKGVDAALSKDPRDIDAARTQVGELYLIEARMQHNIPIYKERTEESFNAFVDAAVLIASTIATAGQGGAILMAIRATAATIATKVTLKGADYSGEEFWADVRGGVFSAVGGKLSEKFVGGLAEAIAVRYAKRAEKLGLTKSWKTWALSKAGAAAKWEADNLVSGVASGIPEALIQDDIEPILTPMSLESHVTGAAQQVGTSLIRGARGGRARRRREKAEAEAAAHRRQSEAEAEPAGERKPTETEAGVEAEAARRKAAETEPAGKAPEGMIPLPLPHPSGTAETARRPPAERALPAKPVTAEPVKGGAPPSRPPGGPVDPVAQGIIPESSAQTLQQFANDHDLVIKVRPMNPEAVERLKPGVDAGGAVTEPAAMPKPDIIKAKSITELDEHIGAPAGRRGFIGLFEPHPPPKTLAPDILEAATKRYEQRLDEWNRREAEYGTYIRDGIMRVEGGLVELVDPRLTGADPDRGAFRKVAGDVDIFDITHADGTALSVDEMNHVEKRLRSMGIAVEHGAHKHWPSQHRESFEKNRGVYEGIIREHTTETPLVAYVPLELPQSAWADTQIRRPARRDSPGHRILPLQEPSVIVSSEYLKEVQAAEAARQARPAEGEPPAARPSADAARTAATVEPATTARTGESARTAPSVETPGGAPAKPAERKWADRVVGSDIPPQGAGVAVGSGVRFEEQPKGRFKAVGKPSAGTTESVIVVDTADKNKKYIFKPLGGEKPVPYAESRGVTAGHYAERALAAEKAAHALGIDTPGVRLVEINGRKGSLTEWREPTNKQQPELMSLADHLRPTDATTDHEADARLRELQADPDFKAAWDNVRALDFLINNVDRVQNFGNYLIELHPDGRFKSLIPIDSELSFTSTHERAVVEKRTSFLGDDMTYSQEMVDKLTELGKRREAFAAEIRPLVGDEAVAGVLHRLDQLIEHALSRPPRPSAPR